uniref:Recep_L_domain domain-containing protein n=1 Tax=Caenorhabditis tropicalis TaxID=1561998 RepID=A0A1I7T7M7_9PELO
MTVKQLTALFKNMKSLIGAIIVYNTTFTNLSFLSGLESIECSRLGMSISFNDHLSELGLTNLVSASCSIRIEYNRVMKKLNFPNLKSLDPLPYPDRLDANSTGTTFIDISTKSPDFCISTDEMRLLMRTETIRIGRLAGKYCEPTFTETLCKKPAAGCVELIGDVELGAEFLRETMSNVEGIYGSLVINGTNITDFGFLKNLKYVVNLEGQYKTCSKINQAVPEKLAIAVENNLNLIDIKFPSLKIMHSSSVDPIAFKNNNKALLEDPSHCYGIRESFGLIDWAPLFDDLICEDIEENSPVTKESTAIYASMIMFSSIVIFSI